ncbi:hypothetical protein [Companilactobacillus sp.]|uniref:hypothetical protein n=1 Tax=Companilactobacillus sp. TaxID=2767905 RepID=UPI0025B9080D|nr:hypothetical protein [Companilactobacillus sp.]MCH4009754.1 hypothetical protein [Companilactobacillus sp.]MCH4052570.1 hypothetical protein [Companilactobacillus sp.]MCH4077696.1 hypothetical protein [Companilactobacillus sp.]MCH4126272.1 hypothetical protein [Companilactobacillus sp.]MCI1311980.1 hypothetical protein [Companilactobacillus sp.]
MSTKQFEKILNTINIDPTKNTETASILQMCKDIESQQYLLPIYQTFVRWTAEKQVALFQYQFSGKAPVSAISVNRIDHNFKQDNVRQVQFYSRKQIDDYKNIVGKDSVTDGQQRLTTNYLAYIGDVSLGGIVLDINKAKFLEVDKNDVKPYQIPVTVLYNKEDNIYEYVEKNMKYSGKDLLYVASALDKVRTKWQKYYYSINRALNMNVKEQEEWFNILNLAGSSVTKDMVFLSRLQNKGIDFYTEYANKYTSIIKDEGLIDLYPKKSTEVSIPLASLNAAFEKVTNAKTHVLNMSPLPSDTKPKQIAQLSEKQIRYIFTITLEALRESIRYYKEFKQMDIDRMDYITNVIGYIVLSQSRKLDGKAISDINDWVEIDLFTNESNGTRRVIYQDLILRTQNINVK